MRGKVGRADVGIGPYGGVTRGAAKRAVGDAGRYESVARSADGRADVGIGPYGGATRGAAKRAVGDAGPYGGLQEVPMGGPMWGAN